jgi:soluble lytic murein transglycosylase-like protein
VNKEKIIKYVSSQKQDDDLLINLLLASYNSGPYRVKRALIRKGPTWLEAKELREAKKYVKKVKSYCYHFSKNNTL